MTLLIFAFGIVAGVLLAFSGAGFFADGASALVLVFILALLLVGGGGALLFGFRRPILRSLFGYAETQVEMFADPLARVARRAIAGDPDGATSAARELVGLTLARYSWVTTRRWIVASLTALIAAMAALAGTALLFRQNQLLEAQSALFADQNAKIEDQSRLLVQQVELAEAARNAALAVEITSIAARIGAVAEGVQQRHADAMQAEGMTVDPYDSLVNVLDPVTDLDQELILRIVSVSRATRPYRFLEQGLRAGDPRDKMRVAMQRRRADLPQTYARLAESNGWQDAPAVAPLTDRPLSPERGQLLTVLVGGGIRNLELLNHFGLDLSFASLPDGELSLLTAQGALLSYANFDGAALNSADFGGGFLDNFRCRRCRIEASTFAAVTADRLRPPMPPAGVPITTQMAGADFGSAVIIDTGFAGANMLAASFDGALLAGVDFSGASLGAASFRGAVLVGTRFEGADLKAVDFDGAVMFSPDPLAELAAAAPEGRFSRDRYSAAPITMDDVMDVPVVYTGIDAEDVATRSGGAPAFRLTREQPFAD